MFRIQIADGLRPLQQELSKLNVKGIRKLARLTSDDLARSAEPRLREQLIRDAPGYRRHVNLIQWRPASGTRPARIIIDSQLDARNAKLLRMQATGGTLVMPDAVVRNYLVRIDRRFSYPRLYQLIQAAYSGTLESGSAARKVYVSAPISGRHYAWVRLDTSWGLFVREGGYIRKGPRGVRRSRLLAVMPDRITIRPRWQAEAALRAHTDANVRRVVNRRFADVLRNRRYRSEIR